jgi:hypothetical protein
MLKSKILKQVQDLVQHDIFTPLEIMPRCSAAGLDFRIIPAAFNAPLEFLTGFTIFPFVTQSLKGDGNYYYSTLTEKSHQKSHHQN